MRPSTKYTAQRAINSALVQTSTGEYALAICRSDGGRIGDPRVVSTTSASVVTSNSDTTDLYTVTALAVSTTIAEPLGTPVQGRKLEFRFLDNGTGRVIAWNPIFVSRGGTLPVLTVASKYTRALVEYNNEESTWDCISTSQEA
ncbi:MAG: hypothetical protein KKH98_14265 [Spirochaetes bacterium]|nr:hypothetical protein [Spirochaetota bacterium]